MSDHHVCYCRTSDELSDEEATAVEQAIDEIVKMNILGIYKKITKFIND